MQHAPEGEPFKTRVRNGLASPASHDGKLLPAAVSPGQLAVASAADLAVLLEHVEHIDDMKNLHEAAAAWEATTKRMKKAFEEIATIAEFRIRLERKIGQQLTQNVKHGGDRSRLHNVTLPPEGGLPDGITKRMASWYRKVASVPAEQFDAYLARQKEKGKPPSSNGAINYAAALVKKEPAKKRSKNRKGSVGAAQPEPRDAPPLPAEVLDAVKRFLQVDLLVGGDPGAFPKAQAVAAELLQGKQLRGDVFVAECLDPATWLPKLAAARTNGSLAQVVVVIPATPGANWFSLVEDGKWLCCFPRGSAVAVIYLGLEEVVWVVDLCL